MVECESCGRPRNGNGSLCPPCEGLSQRGIQVSPLTKNELDIVLAWRSNPEVYRHFRQQDGPLSWEEHVEWFESRPGNRQDFVIEFGGRRVGVVSLDEDEEVGIYLGDISARKQGVASAGLEWLCTAFSDRAPLYAEIHQENEPSRRLFEKCGFHQCSRDGEWIKYRFDP